MARFSIVQRQFTGMFVVAREIRLDDRGSFNRLFCAAELRECGWDKPVAQINYSHTHLKGSIRGMHFQRPPYAEMKLVTCVKGAIWDVVVDLRHESETFLQWNANCLSEKNGYSVLIPEGFAHGFQSLTDDVEMVYVHNRPYESSAEGGLNPFDPVLALPWPLDSTVISKRDNEFPFLTDDFVGLKVVDR